MSDPAPNRAPNRRWFRFGLRTMFVVLTFLAAPLGWTCYQLSWIHQRHEALEAQCADMECSLNLPGGEPHAPSMLRFFGEPGFPKIVLFFQGDIGCDLSGPLTENQQKEFERIKRLFPEAEITAQLWESLYEENPALKAPQR